MMSNNKYTRIYELDLLKNLKTRKREESNSFRYCYDDEVKENSDYYFSFNDENQEMEEVIAGLGYLLWGQMISLKSSKLGINPDNPCPTERLIEL